MKKQSKNLIPLMALFAVFCLGYATVSFGAPSHGVKYTKHNFGTTAAPTGPTFYSSVETEICIFCHTPHNAVAGRPFLWNKTNTAVTWQMYTSSVTLDFTTNPSAPSVVSRMCMSCHDGAGAINAMANPKPAGPPLMTGGLDQIADYWDGPDECFMGCEWRANIGQAVLDGGGALVSGGGILLNDHPISFVYSQSLADPTIKTPEGGAGASSIGTLPFWWSDDGNPGYKVECVTCHDPHINYVAFPAYEPFLRKTMSSSSLCFTCHNK